MTHDTLRVGDLNPTLDTLDTVGCEHCVHVIRPLLAEVRRLRAVESAADKVCHAWYKGGLLTPHESIDALRSALAAAPDTEGGQDAD